MDISTFTSSKYLDPTYLFQHGTVVVNNASNFITNNIHKITNIIHILLFILAIYFLILIIYSAVRILEIRKKEHAHLHHEIEEYAHKHSETGANTQEELAHNS